ncbi:hypothetical protein D1614_14855 [Maribellus luteus]|uniref:Uncharacterized protein n=1 Tax=Maribellus luteus TaxID=2305463 RepID=A0A399SZC7_9BACT|nr:hypothetical protein [Maribellus luteus]RIJ47391.1 hypothetical protein D1614_14855 [Maribellus luteus]
MKNLIYTNIIESSKLKRFFSFTFLKGTSKTKNELQLVSGYSAFTKVLAILIIASLINSKVNALTLPETAGEVKNIYLLSPDSDQKASVNTSAPLQNDTELSVSLLEVEPEARLEMKVWMLAATTFIPTIDSIETEMEPALKLEAWMLDHQSWSY